MEVQGKKQRRFRVRSRGESGKEAEKSQGKKQRRIRVRSRGVQGKEQMRFRERGKGD